jgi:hypothetical protein
MDKSLPRTQRSHDQRPARSWPRIIRKSGSVLYPDKYRDAPEPSSSGGGPSSSMKVSSRVSRLKELDLTESPLIKDRIAPRNARNPELSSILIFWPVTKKRVIIITIVHKTAQNPVIVAGKKQLFHLSQTQSQSGLRHITDGKHLYENFRHKRLITNPF